VKNKGEEGEKEEGREGGLTCSFFSLKKKARSFLFSSRTWPWI